MNEKNEKYTLVIIAEDLPGVIHRISSVLTRRRVNVSNLTAAETDIPGLSRLSILISSTEPLVIQLVKQLEKIVEVTSVKFQAYNPASTREISLLKVFVENEEKGQELVKISNEQKAMILVKNGSEFIIEKTGSRDEILCFRNSLSSFDVKDFVRSGCVELLVS